jgi:osmotically-inducible protein OsmY
VSVFDIGVDSNDGIVVISGEVPSEEVKTLAEEIVSGTAGVVAVDNRLLVNEEVTADPERTEIRERVQDLELRARLAEQLAAVETGDLRVEVHDGVVTLGGEVEESCKSIAPSSLL